MSHYQFSKHSYDKLKTFIEEVDINAHRNDSNSQERKKFEELFPPDTELIKRLKQHISTKSQQMQSAIIEIEDDSPKLIQDILETIEIDKINIDIDIDIGNPTYNSQKIEYNAETKNEDENIGKTLENVMIILKQVFTLPDYDNAMEILLEWSQEQYVNHIFEQIKDNCNCVNLWKHISNCNNSYIVQVYCDVILSKYISSGNEDIPLILQEFIKKYPQQLGATLVDYLLLINEQNDSREFTDSLLLISDENKCKILGQFINQSPHLNSPQLKIVCNLMHSKMDLLTTKNLLDVLSKHATNLTSDRNFGFLLESLMSKSNKTLLSLKDQLKNVINLIPGILKLKLLQMLKGMEQQGDSFSQTMV